MLITSYSMLLNPVTLQVKFLKAGEALAILSQELQGQTLSGKLQRN